MCVCAHARVRVLHINTSIYERAPARVLAQGADANGAEEVKKYLVVPSAMIRGALAALGLTASVRAETSSLPSVVFVVHVHASSRS